MNKGITRRLDSMREIFDTQPLSAKVYEYIKAQILAGEIREGERIPEERVGKVFGISRTPIREAIKRLEEYGLVRVKPRSYAEVVALDDMDAKQIAEVRANLESFAVRLITRNGRQEDFDAIRDLVDRCDASLSAGDVGKTFSEDSLLHLEIARLCGNSHHFELFQKFDAKIQLARLQVHLPLETLSGFVGQHHGLLQAMIARDEEGAVSRIQTHILGQLNHLKGQQPVSNATTLATDG